MANIVIPFAAVAHQPVPSAGFNNNFTEVATKFNAYAVQTDVAKQINVAHTWNADILFVDGLYDIGKAGVTRPRNVNLSGVLTVGGVSNMGDAIVGNFGANKDLYLQPGAAGGRVVIRNAASAEVITISNAGAVAGITSLAIGGALSGVTTLAMAGALSGVTTLNMSGLLTGKQQSLTQTLAAAAGTEDGVFIGTTVSQTGTAGYYALRVNVSTSTAGSGIKRILSLMTGGATEQFSVDNVGVAIHNGQVQAPSFLASGSGFFAPQNATTSASMNVPHSAAPPSITVTNGDLWTQTTGLFVKINGANRRMWDTSMVSPGYVVMTGTLNRSTSYDTATVTLAQLAGRVMALQNDLMTAGVLST